MDYSFIYPYHLPWPQARVVLDAAENGCARTVWLFENPGDRGAFTMLGAALAMTERLDVGVGVVTPYSRAPETAAMEAAQAVTIAPGRVVMGIGAGSPQAAAAIGVPYVPPLTAVPDLVRTLRTFRPATAATGDRCEPPRVHIAATGPKMLKLAAQLGDGVILSMHAPAEFLSGAVDAVASDAGEAGLEPPPVVAYVHVVVGDTSQEALRDAKAALAPTLTRIGDGAAFTAMAAAGSGALTEPLARSVAELRDGRSAAQAIPDELATAMCRVGTLEEVAGQVLAMEASGIDEVVVHAPAAEAALLRCLLGVLDQEQGDG